MNRLTDLLIVGLLAASCPYKGVRVPEDQAFQGPSEASLRGISAASDSSVWASGSGGTVLRSTDGGAVWKQIQVPGAEELDFRDIEAFDARRAVILASGPGEASRVYRTEDGGLTWTETLRNPDADGFFDGIAFWTPSRGVLYGDPVDGCFSVWTTRDGGRSWHRVRARDLPPAQPGEHAFAASGAGITTHGIEHAWFVTGGSVARAFRTEDGGKSWEVSPLPLAQGSPSAGAFGIAFVSRFRGVAVGGDYERPDQKEGTLALTLDGGRSWRAADEPLGGYRSGVTACRPGVLLAVGPNGIDYLDLNSEHRDALLHGGHSISYDRTTDAAWISGPGGRLFHAWASD